jgi:transcriptional regulator with XRE-family HTH domain
MSKNDENSKIHERLRLARERAGLSQGQIAKLMNLHRPTISEIEAGRRKVNTEELSSFAKLYDVNLTWLLNQDPDTNPMVELAARELSNLKPEDLDKILNLLKSLKKHKETN